MKNCICINDQGRPNEIPPDKWVKRGEEYTIIKVGNLLIQGGKGVQIEEIDLSGCAPFLYFAANRFAPIPPKEEVSEEIELELQN